MHKPLPILLLACLVLTGCASHTVSKEQFRRAVVSHVHESICIYRYMGTKDSLHYLKLSYNFGSTTYRIPEAEWPVRQPFPLTSDKSRWQVLSPQGDFVTNRPSVEFYVPKEFFR